MLQVHSATQDWPQATGTTPQPHPRCLEMADTIRNIIANGGGVSPDDLLIAGFSEAEIGKHTTEAARIAKAQLEKQISNDNLDLSSLIEAARKADAGTLPLPHGTQPTLAMQDAWKVYCNARNAFKLYAWHLLREMAMTELMAYLLHVSIAPAMRTCIIRAVENTLRTLPVVRGAK